MSSQQLADILLAQWQLLWPLPPAERIKRIDEIRADYEFEDQLRLVSEEMASCPEISTSHSSLPSSAASLLEF
jgi:hypothetical protein